MPPASETAAAMATSAAAPAIPARATHEPTSIAAAEATKA